MTNDRSRDPFCPKEDSAVQPSGNGLLSRQQALKIAGAVTLGGAFGLLATQEPAHARRRKKKRRSTAQPASILGANVTGSSDATVNVPNSNGDRKLAQTFTSPRSGSLTHVQFEVVKTSAQTAGNYVFGLNQVGSSGVPTNAVLASTTVLDSSIPIEDDSGVTVQVRLPAVLEADRMYALVISRPGSNEFRLKYESMIYSGGAMYYTDPTTGSFVDDRDSGQARAIKFSTFYIPS